MRKGLVVFIFVSAIFSFKILEAQSSVEKIKKDIYVLASDSLMGRAGGSIYADKAANYIVKRLGEIGLKAEFQAINNNNSNIKNIICVIEGEDSLLKNEYILLGAHYDHLGFKINDNNDTIIYNGADDNASGVCAILNLARLIRSEKIKLRRSVILVFFDAEEIGLVGSDYLAKNGFIYNGKKIISNDIKVMMSLDMVGYLQKSKQLKFVGVGMLKDYWQYFQNLSLGKGYDVSFKQVDRSIFTGSDHNSFANVGVPAIYVTTGIVSPYHKPTDDADKIDIQGINSISNYIYCATKNLANSNSIPASKNLKNRNKVVGNNYLGIDMGIGSNTHYYNEGNLTGKNAFVFSAGFFYKVSPFKFIPLKTGINYNYLEAMRLENIVKYNTLSAYLLYNPKANFLDNAFEVSFSIGGFYDYIFHSTKAFENRYLNKNIYGLQIGFDIRIYKFIIGSEIKLGLNNMLDNYPLGKTRQITNLFKVGYAF